MGSVSRAGKKMTVRLTAVCSAMIVLHSEKCFSRLDMQAVVHEIYDEIKDELIPMWTGDFVPEKLVLELKSVMQEWEDTIVENDLEFKDAPSVTAAAVHLLSDCIEVTNNKQRLERLGIVYQKAMFLHDFCDRRGLNWLALDKSSAWIEPMEEILERRFG